MPTTLLDYTLDSTSVSNPDGTFPATFANVTVVPGPGPTPAGAFPHALDFGVDGRGSVDVTGLAIDARQFHIRVVFQATAAVTTRANLVESNRLPFALFATPRNATEFDLVASVSPAGQGWRAATTRFATGLITGRWYVADLVYDIDTVALFVDEVIASVHAFWWGGINELSGHELFIGTWVDGARDHFAGQIAAVSWSAGIPDPLQAQLDERRSSPEWFITHKLETLRYRLDLGEPIGPIVRQWRTGAWLQPYEQGAFMYHDANGVAFEMHGAIYAAYQRMRTPWILGYLVSDESPATNTVGRKSVFTKGAIYWSSQTPALPVLGQIYIDYEALGESRAIGFPTAAVRTIAGGLEQEFQGAHMFYKTGEPNAHEVHGAILAKYLATGGSTMWGFPISNEYDVRKRPASTWVTIGRASECERCTIYWSSSTGAFEVHGDIRQKYNALKGPAGDLGFPISDEMDIPGAAGGRFNAFQNGSILWYGSFDSIVVARPFRLRIGRIDSRESEGWLMGQNDMYIYIRVVDAGHVVYDARRPSSGDWGGDNIVDVDFTLPVVITPNMAKTVTFSIDVWEADPFDDDHLGQWTKVLDASNAWGLRENDGLLNSGSFNDINNITVAVQPVVDLDSLNETEKFWGAGAFNRGTDDISYQKYAAAFSDVDSDTEWWDVTDWLDKAFYELVVRNLAESGNCFGMSLEAIYSRKARSVFSMPLNRFNTFGVIEPEVNVRHCYQVGAGPIWWFVAEFLTGNTHDPKDVFTRTRNEFNRGNHPVICIAQNYDFSGAPHCILPIAWDDSKKPWRITISDPNQPAQLNTLTVDPDANTFRYVGADTYTGGEWTGGRLHYMPYDLVSSAPRTPIWDAILLILAGTIVILGEDAQTESLTDGDGRDLDGLGTRARQLLQRGNSLAGFFVPYKGYNQAKARRALVRSRRGKGTVAGEILMRRSLDQDGGEIGPGTFDPNALAHVPLAQLTATRAQRQLHAALFPLRHLPTALDSRTLYQLASDPKAMRRLETEVRKIVSTAAAAALPGDFRHRVSGLRRGQFSYAVKHGISEFNLGSTLGVGERMQLSIDRIGTSASAVELSGQRDKLVRLEMTNKLGVAGDYVRMAVNALPVAGSAPLHLNMKPGLGGVEIVAGGQRVNARIEVTGIVDRTTLRRSFTLPLEGGARLKLSNLLSQRTLGVSRIDRLFGPSRDATTITSRI